MDDPRGIFDSDDHRRVLGWVAEGRDTPEKLAVAMTKDDVTKETWSADHIGDVLLDLEASGHVKFEDKLARRTAKGTKDLKR